MAIYKGSSADGQRISALEKMRLEHKLDFEKRKEQVKQMGSQGLKKMDDMFQSQDNKVEDHFKKNTIGLVSAADFKKKRAEAAAIAVAEELAKQKEHEKAKKRKEKERKKKLQALSFDVGEVTDEAKQENKEEAESEAPKAKKLKKDPTVDTHFLPDREREQEEAALRERLKEEWKEKQEQIKKEIIEVTYSYWDGSGHRRTISVSKGTQMDQFLEMCRKELCESFHELRAISAENLMYIKEDLIIPHNYSFYDLIVTKARGKSGPLFHFDVHDDVRLASDARVEKDESHAGKIVTRGYYERNKHVFPASRWEVYDPSVKYDKYTIR